MLSEAYSASWPPLALNLGGLCKEMVRKLSSPPHTHTHTLEQQHPENRMAQLSKIHNYKIPSRLVWCQSEGPFPKINKIKMAEVMALTRGHGHVDKG